MDKIEFYIFLVILVIVFVIGVKSIASIGTLGVEKANISKIAWAGIDKDTWGEPYEIDVTRFLIISKGRDRQRNTDDDIVVEMHPKLVELIKAKS